MVSVRIPDVSNHQGAVDWKAVIASGRAGGILKATEGNTYVDPYFAGHWSALGALNAARGSYHFARPDGAVPEAQADFFLRAVGPVRNTDILVLDIEAGSGALSDWARRWLHRVQGVTGLVPWVYSYAPFIRAHLTGTYLNAWPLWLAAYQVNPPTAPPPWTVWKLWQHSDNTVIPGISTPCDESVGVIDVPTKGVAPMYSPPIGPFAAAWLDDQGHVISAITPDGHVYWGKWWGNVAGKPYWGSRVAALIGARDDGQPGYQVTDTAGEVYRLPDGIDTIA